MNSLAQFIIPVTGLKPGNHHFDYTIDDSFFEHFNYSEVRNAMINMHLDVGKEENLLVLQFNFSGSVRVPCDRCYEPLDLPLKGNERLIVKFGTDFHEEDEEIQVVPVGENHFDVSPFIYEYILLSLPVRRVHPENDKGESACDPEILKRLEDHTTSHEPDHRWDALAKLKDKNKK